MEQSVVGLLLQSNPVNTVFIHDAQMYWVAVTLLADSLSMWRSNTTSNSKVSEYSTFVNKHGWWQVQAKPTSRWSLYGRQWWRSLWGKIRPCKIMPQTNIKRRAICGLHTKFLSMLILCKFSLGGTTVVSCADFKLIFRGNICHAVGSTLWCDARCTNAQTVRWAYVVIKWGTWNVFIHHCPVALWLLLVQTLLLHLQLSGVGTDWPPCSWTQRGLATALGPLSFIWD